MYISKKTEAHSSFYIIHISSTFIYVQFLFHIFQLVYAWICMKYLPLSVKQQLTICCLNHYQGFIMVKMKSLLRKWLVWPLRSICIKNNHGHVALAVVPMCSFPIHGLPKDTKQYLHLLNVPAFNICFKATYLFKTKLWLNINRTSVRFAVYMCLSDIKWSCKTKPSVLSFNTAITNKRTVILM